MNNVVTDNKQLYFAATTMKTLLYNKRPNKNTLHNNEQHMHEK